MNKCQNEEATIALASGETSTMSIDTRQVRSASNRKRKYTGINIRIVNDEEMSTRARAFLKQVYKRSGLQQDVPSPELASHQKRFTVLAEYSDGTPLATVSLIFDSSKGLPCDPLFPDSLTGLREDKRRIAEVVSLAVDGKGLGSLPVLIRMFGTIYLHAREVEKCHDFVIEVHPSHAGFYVRAFGFTRFSDQRSCPRVGGAEAILLRLDLALARKTMLSYSAKCYQAVRQQRMDF